MPRATRRLTMAPVDGPRRTSSSSSLRRKRASSRSKGVSSSVARRQRFGEFNGQPADRFLGVFDHHLIRRRVRPFGVRLKVTGTAGLHLQAEGGRIPARVPARSPGRRRAVAGRWSGSGRAAGLQSRAGRLMSRIIFASQAKIHSKAVCRLHRLGPRRGVRETSIWCLVLGVRLIAWGLRQRPEPLQFRRC
jgi:hypothetical protein